MYQQHSLAKQTSLTTLTPTHSLSAAGSYYREAQKGKLQMHACGSVHLPSPL